MIDAWLRPLAEADLLARTRSYRLHAGEDIAARFFEAGIDALRAVQRMPGTGSPRVGELCDVPGLRARRIEGFPCGWFYFIRPDHPDVVRLLADAQDLAAALDAFDEE